MLDFLQIKYAAFDSRKIDKFRQITNTPSAH